MSIFKYIIIFIVGVIIATIIIIGILPFFNIFKSSDYDIISLLSVNIGILQTIIGFGAIFIALFAFINFKSTQDKLKEVDDKLKEHTQSISEHEKAFKEAFNKDIVNKTNISEFENHKKEGEIDNL